MDIGRPRLAGETRRQRADHLRVRLQAARLRIVRKDVDRSIELTDHVNESPVGREEEVPRASISLDAHRWWIAGGEPAGVRIEDILVDDVTAEARMQDMEVLRVGENAMRVRQRRHDLPRCPYDAVRTDRTNRHSVAVIGRSQKETAAPVGHDVRHRIDERSGAGMRQLSCFRVDGKGDHRIWLVPQTCVEEFLVGADCKR